MYQKMLDYGFIEVSNITLDYSLKRLIGVSPKMDRYNMLLFYIDAFNFVLVKPYPNIKWQVSWYGDVDHVKEWLKSIE